MKLVTLVTPTYRQMFEQYLLPSASEFEVLAIPRLCDGDGIFESRNSRAARSAKLAVMELMLCTLPTGTVFLWADADVVLFPPIVPWLQTMRAGVDIFAQANPVNYGPSSWCSGFMVMRVNARVLQAVQASITNLDRVACNKSTDQPRLNYYGRKCGLVMQRMPRELVWTIGFLDHRQQARCNMQLDDLAAACEFTVPRHICAYHASYIVPVRSKMRALEYVRTQVLESSNGRH